jgi:hypothetical protein
MMLRGIVSILSMLAAALASGVAAPDGSPIDAAPTAVVMDANPERLPGHVPFLYDLFTFRKDGGGTIVIGAVAVPAGELRAERVDGRYRYRFDVRFVLADTARPSVFSIQDSVYVSVPGRLPSRHLLHTYVEAEAQPSSSTVQRVIVTDANRPGRGQLYTTPFVIPDYSGPELMLSDIALGLPDAQGGWVRRGHTLALLPTSEFPESSFDLYYEIYNIPNGIPFETELAIERLDDADSDDRVVRTMFSSESTAGEDDSLAELRRVQSALPKGLYRLTITIRDGRGRTAARSRVVQVRGWRSGTTMVAAMPIRANERGS